ncbi:unnamed protein product, partial [marine sediment metagenome]
GALGLSSGVTDHGALTGLDGDDHPQYGMKHLWEGDIVTVPAAGWYRVAEIATLRGQNTVTIYTYGGPHTPTSLTIRWWHDWSTAAGLTLISERGTGYWTEARVTDDGVKAYLEINFSMAMTGLMTSMHYGGGQHAGTLLTGELPLGGDSVRASALLGLFNLNGKFRVDASGNVTVGGNVVAQGVLAVQDGAVQLGRSGNTALLYGATGVKLQYYDGLLKDGLILGADGKVDVVGKDIS